MRDLRNLFLAVIVLTFIGGIGTGVWIGSLTAAPQTAKDGGVERRVEEWNRSFELDRSQNRRLRSILLYYEGRRQDIRNEVNAGQWRRIRELQEECRDQIREMLTDEQRSRYDEITRPLRGG